MASLLLDQTPYDASMAKRLVINNTDYLPGKVHSYSKEEILKYEHAKLVQAKEKALVVVEKAIQDLLRLKYSLDLDIDILEVSGISSNLTLVYSLPLVYDDKVDSLLDIVFKQYSMINFIKYSLDDSQKEDQ